MDTLTRMEYRSIYGELQGWTLTGAHTCPHEGCDWYAATEWVTATGDQVRMGAEAFDQIAQDHLESHLDWDVQALIGRV